MAITIYTNISPRIIVVNAPATGITVQNLLNSVRDWEDELCNLSYDSLIAAAGKEELGSGVAVGITATLLNAQLMFEGRHIPLETGVCTSSGSGIFLTASGGDFINSGIYKGCTVINSMTESMATVIEVVSATEIESFQITGGARDTWLVGDGYTIYPNVQCAIDGGNLVAVDDTGNPINVVLQSPNVQVVRSSASSATTQELGAIQYASFGGGVTIDVINGVAGTAFPIGTIETPANNIIDAVIIAGDRGFKRLFIVGSIIFTTGDSLDNFTVLGESPIKSTITIESGASVIGTEFLNAKMVGILDGNNTIRNCKIGDLEYVEGYIQECLLEEGTIILGGSTRCDFLNCWNGSSSTYPIIDVGGGGRSLGIRAYSGGIRIVNKTGTDNTVVDLISGHVILDSTVTSGTVIVRGVGILTDNSSGATIQDGLLSQECIADSVWNEQILDHQSEGSTGYVLNNMTVSGIQIDYDEVADAVWDEMVSEHVASGTYGKSINDISVDTLKALGLMQENQYLDQTVYTDYQGTKLLTSARIRTYSNAAAVGSNSDVLATYQITTTWSNSEMISYKVVKT